MLEYKEMMSEELDTCAHIVAEAFYDYEYFSLHFRDRVQRRQFLDELIRCEFRAHLKARGVVFLTARDQGQIRAVAKLCTPDYEAPSDDEYLKAGWLNVLEKFGVDRVSAWTEMDGLAAVPCRELGGRSWYLSVLAVAKSVEGKGIGSEFLGKCVVPYVWEAGGETLSLFTNSVANCGFYERNGFSCFDERTFEFEGRILESWSYKLELA